MTKTRLAAAASAAVLILAPATLAAQTDLYGIGGSSSSARRQFETEARQQVTSVLVEYESAWGSDDPATLTRFYDARAVLHPAEGGVLTGRNAIREYFQTKLGRTAPMLTRVTNFNVSGDLAVATVQVTYLEGEGTPDARRYVGTDVIVLKRGFTDPWIILSHFTRPESVPAEADTARNAGG